MLNELKLIAEFLVDKLRAELIAQGHNLTGNLINSIRHETTSEYIRIYGVDYSAAMENGVPQGTYVPVGALIRWVELRGIASGSNEIKSVAFAIRQKIYQEGSPTKGAFRFSSNGRRKGFTEFVVNEYSKEVLQMFTLALRGQAETIITNAVKKF